MYSGLSGIRYDRKRGRRRDASAPNAMKNKTKQVVVVIIVSIPLSSLLAFFGLESC
jgi:hypothetical protein